MNSATFFLTGQAAAPSAGPFSVRQSPRALNCKRIRTRCSSPRAGHCLEFHFQALAVLTELLPKLNQGVVNDTVQVLQFFLLRLAIRMDLQLEIVVFEPDVK